MEETKTRIFNSFLAAFSHKPTEGQEEALLRLANFITKSTTGDAYILKGYAGTGKTTIVSALVKALPVSGIKTVLLAPTGRAAKVMAGYSGKRAFTIHRKIYRPKQKEGNFVAWSLSKNTHKNTLFIVDESSMIADNTGQLEHSGAGYNLLRDLISFVKTGEGCRMLFVGDTAQLPPVHFSSSPALDIKVLTEKYRLRAGHFELTEVVRQKHDSGILFNATRIRDSIRSGELQIGFSDGFADFERLSFSELGDRLADEYSTTGPEDTIVVCRTNKSANNYNKQIRYSGLYHDEEITAGDFIMCVKNNYFWLDEKSDAGFIANGDMLLIRRVAGIEERYGYRYADLTVQMIDYPEMPAFEVKVILDSLYTEAPALTPEQSNDLFSKVMDDMPDELSRTARIAMTTVNPWFQALQIKFGYAVTCHKAQGGQWKKVFVDQGFLREDMIDVNYLRWLYTAITRATEKVYLVNFGDNFFS